MLPQNLVAWNNRDLISHSFYWLGLWVQLSCRGRGLWFKISQEDAVMLLAGAVLSSEGLTGGYLLLKSLTQFLYHMPLLQICLVTWQLDSQRENWGGREGREGRRGEGGGGGEEREREGERMPRTKATIFLLSLRRDIPSLCCVLFIRNKSIRPSHFEREGISYFTRE